jgi:adenylate cyclase class IV
VREVELKAVVEDAVALRTRLMAARALPTFAGAMVDRRYDSRDGALVAVDHVLRLRTYRGRDGVERSVLDWKGPTEYIGGYKVREESSTGVGDAAVLDSILSALGFVVVRTIDREVESFECEGATLRIEQYPRLDTLLEVEGSPESIERAIVCTGIPREAFTADRLPAFVERFEARSGKRGALSHQELASEPVRELVREPEP